jgi:hypothetical protein
LYLVFRRVITQTLVSIDAYFFINCIQICFQHPCVKVYLTCAENILDHRRGFRRNMSTTDNIFCIRQILEKKCGYNEVVNQLFIEFKKAYDSVRKEVLHNILVVLYPHETGKANKTVSE